MCAFGSFLMSTSNTRGFSSSPVGTALRSSNSACRALGAFGDLESGSFGLGVLVTSARQSSGPGARSRCSPAAVSGVISLAASATAAALEMPMVYCRVASWTRSAKGSVYSSARRVSAPAHCA